MYRIIFLLIGLLQLAQSQEPIVSENGMVVSTTKYASEIGVSILKKGGNAIDAACAVGFALAVTSPSNGNIGGGGFMVTCLADGTTFTLDYREEAPAAEDQGRRGGESGRRRHLLCGGERVLERGLRACAAVRRHACARARGGGCWAAGRTRGRVWVGRGAAPDASGVSRLLTSPPARTAGAAGVAAAHLRRARTRPAPQAGLVRWMGSSVRARSRRASKG